MRSDEYQRMFELEDAYWWFVGRRRLVAALVTQYGSPYPRVLDVGCGTGGTLDALSGLAELVGADISCEALGFCRQRGHATLVSCRAESLPFATGVFDLVTCCDTLEHLEQDQAALDEILRVLRPGGVAILTVPAYQWLWSEHDEALSHMRRYSRRGLGQRLVAAGALILRLTYAVSIVFPAVLLFRILSRLRIRKLGPPHTQFMRLPPWLNWLLMRLQEADNWWALRIGFPFGTSVVAVAQKPLENG